MFGFACTHTRALMPLPIWLAHKIARQLAIARRTSLPYLSPDDKTQVAVELHDRRPQRIFGLTIIAPPSGDLAPTATRLGEDVREPVVQPAFADEELRPDDRTSITINPEGTGNGGPAIPRRPDGPEDGGRHLRRVRAPQRRRAQRQKPWARRPCRRVRRSLRREERRRGKARRDVRGAAQLLHRLGPARQRARRDVRHRHDRGRGDRATHQACLRSARRRDHQASPSARARAGGARRALRAPRGVRQVGRTDLSLPWEVTDKVDALQQA